MFDVIGRIIGPLRFAVKWGLIKGTLIKLSESDVPNVLRAIDEIVSTGKFNIYGSNGEVIFSIPLDIDEEGAKELRAAIQDRKITWKEFINFFD